MSYSEYWYLVRSDLHRHEGAAGLSGFLGNAILNPGFQYAFWMRTAAFLSSRRILRFGFGHFARLVLRHYSLKYGISIPWRTRIGPGFYIGHFGQIVVHYLSVIGRNCNISQGVTVGQANRGPRKGHATIGDNVYIGPGAKIVGSVNVGNDVAIGANCVVTRDGPDNAVVVGVPGQVISNDGSTGYVNWTDYR
jgi:serine O-acetyltransferase